MRAASSDEVVRSATLVEKVKGVTSLPTIVNSFAMKLGLDVPGPSTFNPSH